MKHKLNSFSGAFEGTTKGLEGIANALKREEPTPPVPPGPYVPTSFPVGVKITRLSDNIIIYEGTLINTSTCNTITGTAPVYVGPDSGNYVIGWAGGTDGVGTFGYNATTFEILEISTEGVDVSSQYKAEWVDPSTLPPQ